MFFQLIIALAMMIALMAMGSSIIFSGLEEQQEVANKSNIISEISNVAGASSMFKGVSNVLPANVEALVINDYLRETPRLNSLRYKINKLNSAVALVGLLGEKQDHVTISEDACKSLNSDHSDVMCLPAKILNKPLNLREVDASSANLSIHLMEHGEPVAIVASI